MKKILFVLPIAVLLAAGCSSASSDTTSSTDNSQTMATPSPTPTPMMSPTPTGMMMSASSTWQATLMQSDDATKGNYEIQTGGHTIYLNTGKDFSSLVGKPVNVNYNGTMDNFSLVNITAQ